MFKQITKSDLAHDIYIDNNQNVSINKFAIKKTNDLTSAVIMGIIFNKVFRQNDKIGNEFYIISYNQIKQYFKDELNINISNDTIMRKIKKLILKNLMSEVEVKKETPFDRTKAYKLNVEEILTND